MEISPNNKKYFCLIGLLFITNFTSIFAQKTFDRELYLGASKDLKTVFTKEQLLEAANKINKIHPYNSDSINGKSFTEIVDAIDLPKEAITNTERTFLFRKFLDYMTEEDPHIRAFPTVHQADGYKVTTSILKAPPFWGLLISDTLLVHRSLDERLEKGDRILTINNIPVSVLLNYNYKVRYVSMANMMYYYNYNTSETYKITLLRDNVEIEVEVKGIPFNKYNADEGLSCESKIYN